MYLIVILYISKTKDKRGADDDRSSRAEDRRVWVSLTTRLDLAGDRSVLFADRVEARGLDHDPNRYKELEKCRD